MKNSLQLTSKAFSQNQMIPIDFTGEGVDVSPPLQWSNVPERCQSFALICEDPDAPKSPGKDHPFVHWLIYNLSANVTALPLGIETQKTVEGPIFADQGKNSFGEMGYSGPMPPPGHGIHHYHFILYALDTNLGVKPGVSKSELWKAMEGHVLAKAELVGTYERLASVMIA